MGLEIFSSNFINKHVYVLEDGRRYMEAQLSKLAIENFLGRPGVVEEDRVRLVKTSTTLFMTRTELDQMTSSLDRILQQNRGRSYGFNKPLKFTFPANNVGGAIQPKLTAVIVVSEKDTDEKLYQGHTVMRGSNVGMWPSVTLSYGNVGVGQNKRNCIFHLDSAVYARPPRNFPFSQAQNRAGVVKKISALDGRTTPNQTLMNHYSKFAAVLNDIRG